MEVGGRLDFFDSVNCVERFLYLVFDEIVMFYLFQFLRLVLNSFEINLIFQVFLFVIYVRLIMMLFLGNLVEKIDYFVVFEFEVFGRNCFCILFVKSFCVCDGVIIRLLNCSEILIFDNYYYMRSIFD